MARRYNVKAGVIFSFLMAALASFPRFIRFDFPNLARSSTGFFYLFVGFFICWLVHHFFLLRQFDKPFFHHAADRAATSIFSCVIFLVVISSVFNIMDVAPVFRYRMTTYQVLSIRIFRAAIISGLTFFVVYYFRVTLNLERSRLENELLKQENLKAQLASLQEQISPHFLFNSLNTLSALSKEATVKEYILRMSEVYRYVLHYQERLEVPVKDELAFIQSYTYILEARFEEGLKVNINISQPAMERKILPFSLQLLVENAVKHNAISYQHPLVIDIYDRQESLVVENDFRPRDKVDRYSGTGLSNLAARYRLSAGKEMVIQENAGRFKVEIPFLS